VRQSSLRILREVKKEIWGGRQIWRETDMEGDRYGGTQIWRETDMEGDRYGGRQIWRARGRCIEMRAHLRFPAKCNKVLWA
jgi:hypothetical protein